MLSRLPPGLNKAFTYKYMEYQHSATATLAERFTDCESEMRDICTYGMSSGFADFIYHGENLQFFHEFQDEIEDYYYDIYGPKWLELSGLYKAESIDELLVQMVWGFVESYCCTHVENEVEAALTSGNDYQGPLYAPHPALK